jgi:hypothetical protein
VGELSDGLYVLVVSVGAQPFVPLDAVAVPHSVGIEAALGGAGGFSLSAGGTQRWGPSPRSCGAVNKRIGERYFKILGWLRPGPLTRSGVRSSLGLASSMDHVGGCCLSRGQRSFAVSQWSAGTRWFPAFRTRGVRRAGSLPPGWAGT